MYTRYSSSTSTWWYRTRVRATPVEKMEVSPCRVCSLGYEKQTNDAPIAFLSLSPHDGVAERYPSYRQRGDKMMMKRTMGVDNS
jgi:hypothetical protein